MTGIISVNLQAVYCILFMNILTENEYIFKDSDLIKF